MTRNRNQTSYVNKATEKEVIPFSLRDFYLFVCFCIKQDGRKHYRLSESGNSFISLTQMGQIPCVALSVEFVISQESWAGWSHTDTRTCSSWTWTCLVAAHG